MATIQKTQINTMNTTVYQFGTQSKQQSSLPTSLQSAGGNAVSGTVKPVNIDNLKTAINTLETKFSSNCCQAQCNATANAYAGTVKTGTTNSVIRYTANISSGIKYYNYYNYSDHYNYYSSYN